MEREDFVIFNGMLDKLTQNGFFRYYTELRDFYEYLAGKHHFHLKTHTVDPASGEIVPIDNKDKFYLTK